MEHFLGKSRYKIDLKRGRRHQKNNTSEKQQRKKQKMTTGFMKSCIPFIENCNILKE